MLHLRFLRACLPLRLPPSSSLLVRAERLRRQVRRAASSQKDDRDPPTVPPYNTTREYISKNPELQKLLADLYEDYQPEKQQQQQQQQKTEAQEEGEPSEIGASVSDKFSEFKDTDGTVIYDVDEERALREKLMEEGILEVEEKRREIRSVEGIEESVGDRGVFDISDLAALLRRENCSDLCVLRVDPSLGYVDHLVVATCRSPRHLVALAEFVNKAYKHKTRHKEGLRLEGVKSAASGWVAVDMGNIALHLFTYATRRRYDLESLWALGPEHDDLSRPDDPLEQFMREGVEIGGSDGGDFLADLKPLP